MTRADQKFALLCCCAIAVAVFFIGVVTGLRGAVWSNSAFLMALGALGACVVTVMSRLAAKKKQD